MKILLILSAILITFQCHAETTPAAKRLLAAMNVRDSYRNVLLQMEKQYNLTNDPQQNPFADPKFREAYMNKIYDGMAQIYADVYTEEELDAITAFFESDAGQAFLKKKPLLTEKYIELSRELMVEALK